MCLNEENYRQLPDKLIFYILSYLPLSSLFKFRSVCKLWNTLFLHPHLAFLHYRNSETWMIMILELSIITRSSRGLYLQKFTNIHDSSTKRYRIECSILRQRLDIPNPLNPSLCITLDFVLDNLAVKLISVHQHGYELPNLYHEKNKRRNGIQIFFRMGVAYCIWHIDDPTDIEIDVLDMLNFLKELMTFIAFADNSVLFYMKQDKKYFCAYDMNTGILNTTVLENCINSSEDVMDVIAMMMFFRCGGFFNY
ncbi:hypothetical protein R3W88_003876 [Solanum pinnatisectum]|uniref:F-box domain-containing protein n=1 Tax=Solanum pinnatisectum TaxID=50273 RepID=A0AAV9MT46_9SOLN|nr:hypothetical protein R3W88_003876 [Solanum pinnatisectum]